MEQIEYKNFWIDFVYDCSEGYEELKYYTVWTSDRSDCVSFEFSTIEEAKFWIDQNQEN